MGDKWSVILGASAYVSLGGGNDSKGSEMVVYLWTVAGSLVSSYLSFG